MDWWKHLPRNWVCGYISWSSEIGGDKNFSWQAIVVSYLNSFGFSIYPVNMVWYPVHCDITWLFNIWNRNTSTVANKEIAMNWWDKNFSLQAIIVGYLNSFSFGIYPVNMVWYPVYCNITWLFNIWNRNTSTVANKEIAMNWWDRNFSLQAIIVGYLNSFSFGIYPVNMVWYPVYCDITWLFNIWNRNTSTVANKEIAMNWWDRNFSLQAIVVGYLNSFSFGIYSVDMVWYPVYCHITWLFNIWNRNTSTVANKEIAMNWWDWNFSWQAIIVGYLNSFSFGIHTVDIVWYLRPEFFY